VCRLEYASSEKRVDYIVLSCGHFEINRLAAMDLAFESHIPIIALYSNIHTPNEARQRLLREPSNLKESPRHMVLMVKNGFPINEVAELHGQSTKYVERLIKIFD